MSNPNTPLSAASPLDLARKHLVDAYETAKEGSWEQTAIWRVIGQLDDEVLLPLSNPTRARLDEALREVARD